MYSSLLLQTLKTLSATERRDVGRWVESTAFNNRPEVLTLYQHLNRYVDQNPSALEKTNVWAQIYPSKVYDPVRMDLLISYTLEVVRKWLQWQEWQADSGEAQLTLVRALRKRGLDKQFEKEAAKFGQMLVKQPRRDAQFFRQQYRLDQELQQYQVRTTRSAVIQPVNDKLTISYLLELLQYLSSMASLSAVSGHRKEAHVQEAILEAVSEVGFIETVPLLRFYRDLLAILKSPESDEAFQRVKAFLGSNLDEMTPDEGRSAYLAALNYCIRNANAGKAEYLRSTFEICRMGVENRALFEGQYLSPFTYKNVVTAGLSVGEFEWVRLFLDDYKAYLPARDRQSTYLYNRAVWNFRQAGYDEALELLRDADFPNDPLTGLAARAMLVQIYVEKSYFDALESLLDSFQAFLKRQKNLGYQTENYQNLIRFTRRYIRLSPGDRAARKRLFQEIENTLAVAEKRWLLARLQQG